METLSNHPNALVNTEFKSRIEHYLSAQFKGELRLNEPLARHTTLKIGGMADALFYPADLEDLTLALKLCREHEIPWFLLGNGSNLLVRDGGIRGLVIKLNRGLNRFELLSKPEEAPLIFAEAGMMLPKIVEFAKQSGFSGLESLYGVPGTVGGALFMNAGTREGEISAVVEEIVVLNAHGKTKKITRAHLEFDYRFLKLAKNEVIVSGLLKLKKSTPEKVAEQTSFFQSRRLKTQPLDQPNCGSVFKNPPKAFAAVLIEELGLKGVRVGQARISEKHANWIVNEGKATAKDVLALIGLVRDKVKEVHGIKLEVEVKIVGEE